MLKEQIFDKMNGFLTEGLLSLPEQCAIGIDMNFALCFLGDFTTPLMLLILHDLRDCRRITSCLMPANIENVALLALWEFLSFIIILVFYNKISLHP